MTVSRIYSSKPVSEDVNEALNVMCEEVCDSLQKAKDAGVPQGLIVAIMSSCWHEETARMLAIRDNVND